MTKTNPRPMGHIHLFAVKILKHFCEMTVYLRPLLLAKGPVINYSLREIFGKGLRGRGWGAQERGRILILRQ